VNVGLSEPELYCDDEDFVFNNDHGTGTNLFAELELAVAALCGAADPAAALLNDNKPNSTLPVAGLMIVSSSVAIRWPDASFTVAPLNCVARTDCAPSRPVALKCLVLELRTAGASLDGWPCESACARTDAPSIEHAAHTNVIFRNLSFIPTQGCDFYFE
jgi:hypothetical protein